MNIELIKPSIQHKELLIDMLTEWKNDIMENNTNSSPWKIFANDFHDFEYYFDPCPNRIMLYPAPIHLSPLWYPNARYSIQNHENH